MLTLPAINAHEIHPLTDFLRNAKAHVAHLKETGAPEVLTVNGKAEVIMMGTTAYHDLLDRLERAELVASLRQAMTEMDNGGGIPFEELEAELDQRYGV